MSPLWCSDMDPQEELGGLSEAKPTRTATQQTRGLGPRCALIQDKRGRLGAQRRNPPSYSQWAPQPVGYAPSAPTHPTRCNPIKSVFRPRD